MPHLDFGDLKVTLLVTLSSKKPGRCSVVLLMGVLEGTVGGTVPDKAHTTREPSSAWPNPVLVAGHLGTALFHVPSGSPTFLPRDSNKGI